MAYAVELLRYQGRLDLAKELEPWVPPKFPVGGNDLKEAGVPGVLPFESPNSLECSHVYCSFRWQVYEHGDSTPAGFMENRRLSDDQRGARQVDSQRYGRSRIKKC